MPITQQDDTEIVDPSPRKGATFNPQQNYVWQPDTIFPLKGLELHALKQILTSLIQPAEAQRAIAAYEALKLVDNIIKEGVENSLIQEAPRTELEKEN